MNDCSCGRLIEKNLSDSDQTINTPIKAKYFCDCQKCPLYQKQVYFCELCLEDELHPHHPKSVYRTVLSEGQQWLKVDQDINSTYNRVKVAYEPFEEVVGLFEKACEEENITPELSIKKEEETLAALFSKAEGLKQIIGKHVADFKLVELLSHVEMRNQMEATRKSLEYLADISKEKLWECYNNVALVMPTKVNMCSLQNVSSDLINNFYARKMNEMVLKQAPTTGYTVSVISHNVSFRMEIILQPL